MSASEADERALKNGDSNRAHRSAHDAHIEGPCAGMETQSISPTQVRRMREEESVVPFVGIELTTYRLQGDCSTTELKRHI